MRILLITVLLLGLIAAGCAPARIYTFEKERVDQDMSGNRGYAKGAPPLEPAEEAAPKRTLIGVDFEIGLLPSEKEKVKQIETEEIKKEDVSTGSGPAEEEETIAQEEWVK